MLRTGSSNTRSHDLSEEKQKLMISIYRTRPFFDKRPLPSIINLTLQTNIPFKRLPPPRSQDFTAIDYQNNMHTRMTNLSLNPRRFIGQLFILITDYNLVAY